MQGEGRHPVWSPKKTAFLSRISLITDLMYTSNTSCSERGPALFRSFGTFAQGTPSIFSFYFWLNPIPPYALPCLGGTTSHSVRCGTSQRTFWVIFLAVGFYRCMLRSAVGHSIPPSAGFLILKMLLQLPPEAVLWV